MCQQHHKITHTETASSMGQSLSDSLWKKLDSYSELVLALCVRATKPLLFVFFNHFAKCASNVTLFNMGQHWCLPGYRSTWSSAGFVHSDWLIILLPVWALVTDQLVQNMAETPDCQSSAGNWPAGINRADYCSCQTNTGNWPVGKKIADYPGCRFSASNWPVGKNIADYLGCRFSTSNWPVGKNTADYLSCRFSASNWPVGKNIADYPGCWFSTSNWPAVSYTHLTLPTRRTV